jgi:biopolymer transport protein ExbD
MSMSQANFFDDDSDSLLSEINMTPLVDVMLVLLVIFLVTLPVIRHAIHVDLPRAAAAAAHDTPDHVDIAIAADGSLQWNGAPLERDALAARIAAAAAAPTPPMLRLYADRHVQYEFVADVMAAAQAGGLSRIGFVTAPPTSH